MATSTGGTPYVASTDLVADYPTTSLALANRTDVVASGGPVLVKTAGYTITVADILAGNKFLYNSASGGTFTLPTASLVDGMVVEAAQIGSGALTVSGGTIVGTTSTSSQYQALTLVYVASGTTWYSVGAGSASGMTLLSATTFSGSATVSTNNCFSSTYTNYLTLVQVSSTSDGASLMWRFRASGTDQSGSNYFWRRITNTTATSADAATTYDVGPAANSGNVGTFAINFTRVAPYSISATFAAYQSSAQNTGHSGLSYSGSAADGFTIYASAGNITGSVRTFGYRIA